MDENKDLSVDFQFISCFFISLPLIGLNFRNIFNQNAVFIKVISFKGFLTELLSRPFGVRFFLPIPTVFAPPALHHGLLLDVPPELFFRLAFCTRGLRLLMCSYGTP